AAWQAMVAKLLAAHPADRYGDARAIREDLERARSARVTQAEREGWPAAGGRDDEPPTVRTQPSAPPDEDLPPTVHVVSQRMPIAPSTANFIFRPAEGPAAARHRPYRYLQGALLLPAFFVVGQGLVITAPAERLRAGVPA